MNNTLNYNIIHLLLLLAKQAGQQIAIDKDTNNIYFVENESESALTLQPVAGGASVVHFNKEHLIMLDNIKDCAVLLQNNSSETADVEQNSSGNFADVEQNSSGHGAELQQKQEQTASRTGPAQQQNIVGAGVANLQRFSNYYSGIFADIANKIEKTTNKILKNTEKKETIKKTIEDYNLAKRYAQNANLFELKNILEKLQARAARQNAADDTRQLILQRAARAKKIKIAVCAIAFVSALTIYFFAANRNYSPTVLADAELSCTVFKKTVQRWQKENNKKIYPYGLRCLEKACKDITDENEIYLIISKNMQNERTNRKH